MKNIFVTILSLLITMYLSIAVAQTVPDFGAAVNEQRLTNAAEDPEVWLNYGRTYDEQRYSPLNQINKDTIDQVGLAWYADMGTSRGQEATPIVVDGALYISTAWSNVLAFNVRTGELLWEFDPEVDRANGLKACCDVVNRGVAVWEGKVFVGALDGRLIALDSKTGERLWETQTFDPEMNYTITGAPRVIKGNVIIGNGGAEYGVRGYVTAYDADTGDLNWRFFTVPGNPAEGYEQNILFDAASTWTGEWWRLGGGGTVWDAMAYDVDLDLLYIGVGNGSPWNQSIRSPGGGDNLFLTSIVALDPDDGTYRWHYQTVPGETWDYTSTQHIMLADLEIAGEERRVVMQAPKNGFFYVLDAATGQLISAENYVPVNWATHIDLDTGRPVENPDARFNETGVPFIVSPSALGGHNWYPMSYSQNSGLVYIPITENYMGYVKDSEFVVSATGWNTGVDLARGFGLVMNTPGLPEQGTFLQAWDPVAQQEVWRVKHEAVNGPAGVLSTGAGLVFQGNRAGEFVAYDDGTGERVWSTLTQAGAMAAPATFEVDGQQYIALLVGSPALPSEGPGAAVATTLASTNNSRLLVYRIGGEVELPNMPVQAKSDVEFEIPQTDASNEIIAAGESSFNRNCAVCHGSNGISLRPDTYPDLRQSSRMVTEESWSAVVLGGELQDNGMISFANVLDDGEAEAIRAYIISRANTEN
ncbi:MAG: PQQ-dependent dehydrogenase, methanol/ethanol family [SAR86 cluster bacterium]|uniref:PQQ-dependent dehydrogenase, methanol/ethanol family n=1 Tax=SAR86 cluster bacterium TaxID=2030880 RepID=A0A2A5AVU2_9GAMM|nr:MAG: PQQ-dependent dehydrogenase, methanol/ethanol family [SAR86 cluster bacterium]